MAGSGRQALAPNASLELCNEDVACDVDKVVASVRLQIGGGDDAAGKATEGVEPVDDGRQACELDRASIETRNKNCGEHTGLVDF